MKYAHDVRYNGVYYKAGEEVPQSVAMPIVEEDATEATEAKAEVAEKKRSRKSKQ